MRNTSTFQDRSNSRASVDVFNGYFGFGRYCSMCVTVVASRLQTIRLLSMIKSVRQHGSLTRENGRFFCFALLWMSLECC